MLQLQAAHIGNPLLEDETAGPRFVVGREKIAPGAEELTIEVRTLKNLSHDSARRGIGVDNKNRSGVV